MPTTTNVKQVKINIMTEAQAEQATISPDEFYAITDAAISYDELVDKPTIGNATLTINQNSSTIGTFTANATTNNSINITVPTQPSDIGAATAAQGALADTALQPSDVINNTSSNDTDMPLSAAMGKSLQEQVDNVKARGRFLALWNCATGLAQTNPPQNTYEYKAGDYFIIGTVASSGGTNYKPTGSSYTIGVASTVIETADVAVNDVYYYDGTSWALQINTQKEVAFVNIAGDPYDNTNLAAALNAKIDDVQMNGTSIVTNKIASIPKATTNSLGVVAGSATLGISVNNSGQVYTNKATNAEIEAKTQQYNPIVPNNLDKAVMEGLGNNGLTWSDTYKSNARTTIGAVGDVQVNGTSVTTNGVANVPIATASSLGVVYATGSSGITVSGTGNLSVNGATTTVIDGKTNTYRPIVPSVLDYAIKIGVTTNTYTLTSTEQENACAWLGASQQTIFRDYE